MQICLLGLTRLSSSLGEEEGGRRFGQRREIVSSLWHSGDVKVVGMEKGTEKKGRGKKSELERDDKYVIFFLHSATVGRFCLFKFT